MKQKKHEIHYKSTARRFKSIKQNISKPFPKGVDQPSRAFPLIKGKILGIDLVGFQNSF